MSALRVVRPGPRITVQDGGRPGFGHLGVPAAGAVDRAALHAANMAVGNAVDAAALELVLGGAVFVAEDDVVVAVAGPGVEPEALQLTAGQELRVGRSTQGVYVYVAVQGGVDVPLMLGSRSRDTLSGLGPPPLAAGDAVAARPCDVSETSSTTQLPTDADDVLRVFPGPHLNVAGAWLLDALVDTTWTVAPASDRTGLRLSGPVLTPRVHGIASEGLVPGAVQLPPDGQPILFLANHPVTGGYPVIAVVAHADVGRAAQRRPGTEICFTTA